MLKPTSSNASAYVEEQPEISPQSVQAAKYCLWHWTSSIQQQNVILELAGSSVERNPS
jgi:hypothetical protein